MDDDGPLIHDPAARLGSRNLGGPDGLERLGGAEALGEAAGPHHASSIATDTAPASSPADDAREAGPEASEAAAAASRRAAVAPAGPPGNRSALVAAGVLLAFGLVVALGVVLQDESDGGTDAAGRGGDTAAAGDDDATTATTADRPRATVPSTTATTEPASRAPAEGDCARPDPDAATRGTYLSLACNDARATVRLERALPSPPPAGAHCPVGTDVVLDIPATTGQPAAVWCMRNVRPPHPGDAGRGGGELLVGDCLAAQPDGRPAEVPCDGSAGTTPEYVVRAVPDAMGACPPGSVGSITVEVPLPGTYCVGYA